jgi:hypothetical protein
MSSSSSTFVLPPFCTDDVLRNVRGLNVGDGDGNVPVLFIASYPKSGTTWMQAVVYHLLTDAPLSHISDYTPFLEHTKTWDADGRVRQPCRDNHRRLGWQVFNTHLLPEHLPATARCIYVTRNGRDAAASFYHHLSNQCGDGGIEEGTPFSAFCAEWCAGRGIYGSWLHHLDAWQHDVGRRDVLYVRYEDLVVDPARQLQRVHTFLRGDGAVLDDARLADVLQKVAFQTMRADAQLYAPTSVAWKPTGYNFFRQGHIRGNEELFGPEEHQLFERMVQDFLASKGLQEVPPWLAALDVLS